MYRIFLLNIFICIACNEHPSKKHPIQEDFKMNFYSRGILIKSLSANDLKSVDFRKQYYVFKEPDSLRKLDFWTGDYFEFLYNGKMFVKATIFDIYSSEAPSEEFPLCYTLNGHILHSSDTLQLFQSKNRIIIDSLQIKKLDSFFRSKNITIDN